MSDLTNVFTDIADAIRAKTETQITYKPTEMADAINNIETGGGGVFELTTGSVISSFNMPVSIPEGVTNMSRCFLGGELFNQPLNIPNTVTNMSQCFANCFNFSQPVTIPNSVISTFMMFFNCVNFNQPVTIGEGVTTAQQMFANCYNFNQPVTIPNSVTNALQMFANCNNLNQPVTIGEGVTNTYFMFYRCFNFNQPIVIPNNVTSTYMMFGSCNNFNQPVTLPASLTNTANMFSNCFNLNQLVTIEEGVTSTVYLLCNCYNFNQPVIIPNSVKNIAYMFFNCTGFGSNVYVYSANLSRSNVRGMFILCNNQLPKHIFTDDTFIFNGTATSQSVTTEAMTWTQDGDNFYNTAYNIYIHNVANPYTILNNARYNFNQSSPLPDSPAIVFGSGVRSLEDSFYVLLNSSNTLILFEEGVENLTHCFFEQSEFNQPLTIPSSAVNCYELLGLCSNFNSTIVFRNGVRNIGGALSYCENFASDIWIPESVTDIHYMLDGVSYASGTVHISHNIALGNTDNYIYNSLVNGDIGITLDPSRILNDY